MMNLKNASQVIGLAGVLLVAGAPEAGAPRTFPHEPHLAEDLECGHCHEAGDGGAMKLTTGSCGDCHDGGAPHYRAAAVPGGRFLRFPHAVHAEAFACADCHKAPDVAFPRGKPACDACHRDNDVRIPAAACARCHGAPAQKLVPPDHGGAWRSRHGREARWRVFDRHGETCAACHGSEGCETCHRTERPRSHTGLWRLRTHGASASWDRDSCRTCHETGSCEACHASTAPLNHVGAWSTLHGLTARTRSDESCAACHGPGWCASCHSGR
ncbi:MAG: cytochrome c3 family protein [Deltaproteobacteria bacterium]|nr:cytochrome c3 family protein [Deltaproteobacteria bacterium]